MLTALVEIWKKSWINNRGLSNFDERFVSVISGSVAEFNIKPVMQCYGDIDVMIHYNFQLAVLKDANICMYKLIEKHEHVACHLIEFIDDLPGYVQLRFHGFVDYDSDKEMYLFTPVVGSLLETLILLTT